jgi:hypothetical protein
MEEAPATQGGGDKASAPNAEPTAKSEASNALAVDPIGVPFDKPIIQRMKPLNGILQIPAYYADTGTIFRGRLYWFPLIHRRQPIMELAPTPVLCCVVY